MKNEIKYNNRKTKQLGLKIGNAHALLRKHILYFLAKKLNMHICYHCKKEITLLFDFTIEHKIPYIGSDNPLDVFFDMNNIAFSHAICNTRARRTRVTKLAVHPSMYTYNEGCRCEGCKEVRRVTARRYRAAAKYRLEIKNVKQNKDY